MIKSTLPPTFLLLIGLVVSATFDVCFGRSAFLFGLQFQKVVWVFWRRRLTSLYVFSARNYVRNVEFNGLVNLIARSQFGLAYQAIFVYLRREIRTVSESKGLIGASLNLVTPHFFLWWVACRIIAIWKRLKLLLWRRSFIEVAMCGHTPVLRP